jgi:hypothetical protein
VKELGEELYSRIEWHVVEEALINGFKDLPFVDYVGASKYTGNIQSSS